MHIPSDSSETICPHCGARLDRLALPESVADHVFDLVCFNDECSYFVRGWAWMEQQYGVKTSYRYRLDPTTGSASPIAVWSAVALRSSILPDSAPGAENS